MDYQAFVLDDTAAFERLVLRHKNILIYYLNRLVQSMDTAEELAQDCFVDIYLKRGTYDGRASFKTYLFTIAHNKAVDYIRKNKRIVLTCEWPEEADSADGPEEELLKSEQNKELYAAIRRLKPEYAETILLIHFENLSYAQAAEVMHKSEVQLKVMVHRARKALAREYRDVEWGPEHEK